HTSFPPRRSSDLAVPRWREKRRVPASAAGRIAVPAVLSFWLLFLCTSKEKVTRLGCAAAGETCLDLVGGLQARQRKARLSLAASRLQRVAFSLPCKEKVTKKKAGPGTRTGR